MEQQGPRSPVVPRTTRSPPQNSSTPAAFYVPKAGQYLFPQGRTICHGQPENRRPGECFQPHQRLSPLMILFTNDDGQLKLLNTRINRIPVDSYPNIRFPSDTIFPNASLAAGQLSPDRTCCCPIPYPRSDHPVDFYAGNAL